MEPTGIKYIFKLKKPGNTEQMVAGNLFHCPKFSCIMLILERQVYKSLLNDYC